MSLHDVLGPHAVRSGIDERDDGGRFRPVRVARYTALAGSRCRTSCHCDRARFLQQPRMAGADRLAGLRGYEVMALELIQNVVAAKVVTITSDNADGGPFVRDSGGFSFCGAPGLSQRRRAGSR